MGEFDDMVSEGIDEVQDDNGGEVEVDAGEPNDGASVDVGSEPASSPPGLPTEPAWKPPTREEWEAAQQHAALGRQFAPFEKDIRSALTRGFQPQPPAQHFQPQHQPKPPSPEDEDKTFEDLNAYTAWAKAAANDPRAYVKPILSNVRRALKGDLEKVGAIEQEQGEIKRLLNEILGETLLARKKYATTPEWQKYGEAAVKHVNEGKFNDFDTAWEHEVLKAKAAGATQKQAEAQADKNVGATPAAAAKKGVISAAAATLASAKNKPAPDNEPSLSPGARRGGSVGGKPAGGASSGKLGDKQLRSLVAESLAELGHR